MDRKHGEGKSRSQGQHLCIKSPLRSRWRQDGLQWGVNAFCAGSVNPRRTGPPDFSRKLAVHCSLGAGIRAVRPGPLKLGGLGFAKINQPEIGTPHQGKEGAGVTAAGSFPVPAGDQRVAGFQARGSPAGGSVIDVGWQSAQLLKTKHSRGQRSGWLDSSRGMAIQIRWNWTEIELYVRILVQELYLMNQPTWQGLKGGKGGDRGGITEPDDA